jgi:hypothetical protein
MRERGQEITCEVWLNNGGKNKKEEVMVKD